MKSPWPLICVLVLDTQLSFFYPLSLKGKFLEDGTAYGGTNESLFPASEYKDKYFHAGVRMGSG